MLPKPENKPVLESFTQRKGCPSYRSVIVFHCIKHVSNPSNNYTQGGNRGIGLSVSHGLAEAGADVAIIYRSTKKTAERAAAEISAKHGVKVSAIQADVSDPKAIDAAVAKVVADFGGLDVMVVNAGIGAEFDALNCSPEQYREQMAVNLDGAFYSAQAAAKVFKAQGLGNIIFTASISATIVNGPQFQSVVSFDAQSSSASDKLPCVSTDQIG